jgi:PAS domain S-box-containing protein
MSEFINNSNNRTRQLTRYAIRMLEGERGSELYEEYKDDIKFVTPRSVIAVVDELMKTGEEIDIVKRTVNKILNAFHEPIKKFGLASPEKNSLIYYLMAENEAMQSKMTELKTFVKLVFGQNDSQKALVENKRLILDKLNELKEFEKHYQKKENILFPHFEKIVSDFRCVNVMWSMHDDARKSLNKMIDNLSSEKPMLNQFNVEMGKLFFSVLPVIFRDNYILYPVCLQNLSPEIQYEMLEESLDLGFSFIPLPILSENNAVGNFGSHASSPDKFGTIDLETGHMTVEQIVQLFNHLPVDITFVDENDEVVYFSNPKDRFFTRSKAIIGRKVQNCHPPESIDVVNKIVESFRAGLKDKESFWIQMKGRFILIQYFAVRNENGDYKGVVEVSQDISEIRKLDGERRLLD